ncbi:mechanosensitive ion channel [Vibrio sp. FNV 38]|nr:mechanosensitive ion channel [Vibrio sp. FNV 38]
MLRLSSCLPQFIMMLVFMVPLCAASALPNKNTIENEISRLKTELPKNDLLLGQYQTLLNHINNLAKQKVQRDEYQKIVSQFPEQKERLQTKIREIPTLDVFHVDVNDTSADLSQSITALQASLNEWRLSLQNTTDQSNKLASDRTTLPQTLAQLEQRIEQASLSAPKASNTIEDWLKLADFEELKQQRDVILAEIQSLDERTELFRLEQQWVANKIQMAAPLIIEWQERLTSVEQASVKDLISRARSMSASRGDVTPETGQQLDDILKDANELETVLSSVEISRIETQRLDSEQRNLADEQRLIKDNLSWLSGSTSFGASIRAQLQRLPTPATKDPIPDKIANAHIRKYEIGQNLDDDAMSSVVKQNRIAGPANQPVNALAHQLRVELLANYEKLIVTLSKQQLAKNRYVLEVDSARSFLEEQQLWTRSNVPLWDHLTNFTPLIWTGNATPISMLTGAISSTQMMKFVALFIIYSSILLVIRHYFNRRSEMLRTDYAKVFGHPIKDRFSNSITLLVYAIMRSCALPLWFGITTITISTLWPTDATSELKTLIITASAGLFANEMLYSLSFKQGLLSQHLGWPEHIRNYLHKESFHIRWPFIVLCILIFLIELISGNNEAELSRILFLLLIAGMVTIYTSVLRADRLPSTIPSPFNKGFPLLLIRGVILGSFLAIAVMGVMGYYIASWMILIYQQLSIFVILGFLLTYQMCERWLKLEYRQLSYQRLIARREELIAQQAEQSDVQEDTNEIRESFPEIEEQALGSEVISEQSMTLLRGLSLIGLIIAILTLWSSALEMTSMLDKVVVWQVNETTQGGVRLVDITLQSVIYALITAIVTLVGVRNLPGILELLILRRLELSPGTGYAVTTVLRYLIMMAGLLSVFSLLGFQWSRLQWLVAAFGVGLGFGLQEIFANFISGLILLFERPIRIGDIVTINDLSGTVSKIQTRATTIIDWDNKEIVVPNKTFITEKLINWSLTDPVTRIVLPIGVAYGSDVEKVEDLLHQISQEHPFVLKTPSPTVVFLAFGASSLDFELRVHISDIDRRLSTIHTLNKAIDRAFRENDIEIAFPQMDIHIRDTPPRSSNSGDPSP